MNLLKRLFGKHKPSLQQRKRYISIPKGYYVAEAGQDPLHMLWFVVLVNFDNISNNIEHPRLFVAEEYDSFEEALQECIKKCGL